jgi:hypothetical protein
MTQNLSSKKRNTNKVVLVDFNHSVVVQKMKLLPESDMLEKIEVEIKKFPKMSIRATVFYKCITQF